MTREHKTVILAREYVQHIETKHAADLFAKVFVGGKKARVKLWQELQRLRVPKPNPHEK